MSEFDGDLKCPECGAITEVGELWITEGMCINYGDTCDFEEMLRDHYISEQYWVNNYNAWKLKQVEIMKNNQMSWADKMENAGWYYVDGQGWTKAIGRAVAILSNDESQAYRTLNEVPEVW